MNRGQLRTELASRLGIPPAGDGLLTENVLSSCIQLGLTDLSVEAHWPWLLHSLSLTFVDGVAAKPDGSTTLLPAVLSCRELTIDGERAKRAGSLQEYLDAITLRNQCLWFEQGGSIVLAPVPATAPTTATLFYNRVEPALVAEAQVPLLPEQHHNTLIARAAYHADTRRAQYERAAQHMGEYNDGVKRMKASYPSRTGPRTVRLAGTVQWARWA